jgi:CMP-N,N'-diacetyllegionaminic acid synthase
MCEYGRVEPGDDGGRVNLIGTCFRTTSVSGDFMAVIPARGGSKRAPRKNIRPLGEKPLLAYTIAATRDAGLGNATFVSTEDAEIAAVAKTLGCAVIPRPDALATDAASTEIVLLHALDEAAKRGWHPRWILTLPPTSPFRRASTIRFFMDHAATSGVDCLLSLTETRASLWRQIPEGKIGRLFPDAPRRQQDRAPLYEENSAIYLTAVPALRATGSVLGTSQRGIAIDPVEGFDINSELDFVLADALRGVEPSLAPRLV